MPDLAPLTDAQWPPELADLLKGFAGGLNVYRVMAHHPALVRAWTDLRTHIVTQNALTPQQQEIVILRAGHRFDSEYEWAHHVVRGRAAGLSEARIAHARAAKDRLRDDQIDDLLIAAVDHLRDDGRLPHSLRETLMARIGAKGVLDLMATVGMYSTLAFILKTFETPIDAGIAEQAAKAPA
ncbi:MAG: carboxymuconolactone decarboxylase [Caulobacteraceae bacterium]|nr:carboxymuconolactone decarboxylase [Caulobacteraceae bacterium]